MTRSFGPDLHRRVLGSFGSIGFIPVGACRNGNRSRQPETVPGCEIFDLMSGDTLNVTERAELEFRAAAFNATKTQPFDSPSGSVGNPAFGRFTTALDSSAFALVVKLDN